MVSLGHEAVLLLFRNLPTLAPDLLRDVLHVPLPAYTDARIESAELTDIKPAEYHADLVVLLSDGKPVFAIVVEVQLRPDLRKRFTWPVYVVNLRARLECPTCLLVVAADQDVARWCAETIETGHPGWDLKPLVLGPSAVPVVTDEKQARAMPELGVLSVMAHANTKRELEIARAVYPSVAGLLDKELAKFYADIIDKSLSEAARRALEEWMKSGGYQLQGPFALKHIAQGRREQGVRAVIEVLEVRGLAIPEAVRQRIASCEDIAELERWLGRAVVVKSASELFEEPVS